eukprot:3435679-Prymnesium_polylepis.1
MRLHARAKACAVRPHVERVHPAAHLLHRAGRERVVTQHARPAAAARLLQCDREGATGRRAQRDALADGAAVAQLDRASRRCGGRAAASVARHRVSG